jgi:hypothetical protein
MANADGDHPQAVNANNALSQAQQCQLWRTTRANLARRQIFEDDWPELAALTRQCFEHDGPRSQPIDAGTYMRAYT